MAGVSGIECFRKIRKVVHKFRQDICTGVRHVERRYLKVRELVALGEISVLHVPTASNRAGAASLSATVCKSVSAHDPP